MAEDKTPKNETLGSLLQAPMPLIPKTHASDEAFDKWRHDLYEWLKRMFGYFTGDNIINTIIISDPNPFPSPAGIDGLGVVKVEVFVDYAWIDGTTAFGGTNIGHFHASGLFLSGLQHNPSIGDNAGSAETKFQAVRITARVVPGFTENYKFKVDHDDGSRLYVNGVLEQDDWSAGGTNETGDIALVAGTPATIRLEVVNSGGDTFTARLRWKAASETGGNYRSIPYSQILAPI